MTTFEHQQAAHCESGVASALLRHVGIQLSEPMAFGLASGLSFAYIPMVKLSGLPLISYRMPPGQIVKTLSRRLGVKMHFQRFRNADDGMQELNRQLAQGRAVGLQTSVYWLPYFPPDMRFHFNAHNLIVHSHKDNVYQISDPTFEQPVEAAADDLRKARFVKGVLAPKGLMYYPTQLPKELDFRQPANKALKRSAKMMLKTPLPIIGVRGIRFVSKKIRSLQDVDDQQAKLMIGHMVRMQEEIGTGGGGFRFLHASFLQELGQRYDHQALSELSTVFTDIGDEWRRYALYCAKMIKGRMSVDYDKLADQLLLLADLEQEAFSKQLECQIKVSSR